MKTIDWQEYLSNKLSFFYMAKRRGNTMNYFKFCRCLMFGILMGLLMIAEISAKTFDGVEFPAGGISFADSVQLFEAGTYTTQTDTSNVLGAPDYAGGDN
jgi:hypothetical protein